MCGLQSQYCRVLAAAVIAAILAAAVSLAAGRGYTLAAATLLVHEDHVVVKASPCRGELSRPPIRITVCYATPTRVHSVAVLDYEQATSIDRIDLYGYLAVGDGGKMGCISFTYPKSAPCWPLYIIIEVEAPTIIGVRAVAYGGNGEAS
jgi:hypothetical protein